MSDERPDNRNDQGAQEWLLRQCGGWKVAPVPCGKILTAAGYVLDGVWKRNGVPFPGIDEQQHPEVARVRDVARDLGMRR